MKKGSDVSGLIEKARKSVQGAEVLLKEGLYDFSASRSYYAMFYAAQALLLTKNLSFSKHAALISAFGREFVKSALLERKFHRYLADAFRLRQAGDYETTSSVNKEEARKLIEQADEFIAAAESYLKNKR
jgi:uncharacterized protein (UPF0332 family)